MQKQPDTPHICSVCGISSGSDSVKPCKNCHKEFYCGVEHQCSHWETHKDNCYPFIEDQFSEALVSTRKVKTGEILWRERPIVSSPFSCSPSEFWGVCLGCNLVLYKHTHFVRSSQPGFNCEKCSWPLCSPNCSKVQNHSTKECEKFATSGFLPIQARRMAEAANLSPNIIYDAIRVLRCLFLRDYNVNETNEGNAEAGIWKQLLTLESHTKLRGRENHRPEKFMATFIKTAWPANRFSSEEIRTAFRIVGAKSRAAGGGTGLQGKFGVYPEDCDPLLTTLEARISVMASQLKHSCVPNCQIQRGENMDCIQALTDIPPGTILTVFIDVDKLFFTAIAERKSYLRKKYLFNCKCPRCSTPDELGTFTSAIQCLETLYTDYGRMEVCEGNYLPLLSYTDANGLWKCTSDKKHFGFGGQTREYDVLFKNVVAQVMTELYKIKRGSEPEPASATATALKLIQFVEEQQESTLHPNHVLLLSTKMDVFRIVLKELMPAPCTDTVYNLARVLLTWIQIAVDLFDKMGVGFVYLRGMLRYFQAQALHKICISPGFLEEIPRTQLKLFIASQWFTKEAIFIFEHMSAAEIRDTAQYKWLISQKENLDQVCAIIARDFRGFTLPNPGVEQDVHAGAEPKFGESWGNIKTEDSGEHGE